MYRTAPLAGCHPRLGGVSGAPTDPEASPEPLGSLRRTLKSSPESDPNAETFYCCFPTRSRVAFTLELQPSDEPVLAGTAPRALRFALDRCGGNVYAD